METVDPNNFQSNAPIYSNYQNGPSNQNGPNTQYPDYQNGPSYQEESGGYAQQYPADEVADNKDNFEDMDYTSSTIRNGFIKKTYGILLSQLAISLFFISLTFIGPIRDLIRFDINRNPLVLVFLLVFMVVTIVVFVVFVCCRSLARTVPYNYCLLFAYTLCMSFYLSLVCAEYETSIVFSALLLTCAATIGLTIYASTTKTDYTYCGGFLFALLLILIFSAFLFFWIDYYVCYCAFGVLVYSLYLIYDTQLILGKFGTEYKIDDYCFAALNLYIDIIYLFLKILQILASAKGK